MGEAEQRTARRIGMPPEDLGMFAFCLWGHSLTDERERRAESLPSDLSPGSSRLRRAHITRERFVAPEPDAWLFPGEGDEPARAADARPGLESSKGSGRPH
jgi:hypothetical protein